MNKLSCAVSKVAVCHGYRHVHLLFHAEGLLGKLCVCVYVSVAVHTHVHESEGRAMHAYVVTI